MSLFVGLGECMVELVPAHLLAETGLWRVGIAGDTLNTTWYARAFLPASWAVAYATVIGRDPFSEKVAPFLAEAGITTDRLIRHDTRSIGLYAVSLTHGERSFSYWRETAAARTMADHPAQLAQLIAGANLLHVSGITLAILPPAGRQTLFAALAKARKAGTRIAFDPNIRPKLWESPQAARATITKMAGLADILLPSFDDETALFGDTTPASTCARYAAAGASLIVVKNGGNAIELYDQGKQSCLDQLARVVPQDTTGAGDSFNGSFLAGLLTGQTPQQAIWQAHAVAMRVVGYPGALMPFSMLRDSA